MDFLRLDEIPRYLDACDDVFRPLAETLIATGRRISEALALRWADIDWSARSLRVVRSRKAEGHGSTKATASAPWTRLAPGGGTARAARRERAVSAGDARVPRTARGRAVAVGRLA
jgi:integrase